MLFRDEMKKYAIEIWEKGYNHPFVQEIGKGELSIDKFKFYLEQDYRYLLEYAKVFAMGVSKSPSEYIASKLIDTQVAIMKELNTHISYMKSFGMDIGDFDEVKPSLYNRVYTNYMKAVAYEHDIVALLTTVFPCGWTYGEYAKRLKKDYAHLLENNKYRPWIEAYASDEFEESYIWIIDIIEDLIKDKDEKYKNHIKEIFKSSVEFEYLFWDMSYNIKMSI